MKEVVKMVSIYNVKAKFLILDIETTLDGKIFDISFGIYSRQEGKIGSFGYIVAENEAETLYFQNKLIRYEEYKQQKKYKVEPFAKIMAIMAGIIKKYSPDYATAYNSGFDFTKIQEACKIARIENPLEKLQEVDLYHMATQTLGKQKWYKEFVDNNKLQTPKGNRKTNAQTMYAYMILNPEFEEEHTGLADIEIEIEILERVLRQKKKMDTKRNERAWKIAQG